MAADTIFSDSIRDRFRRRWYLALIGVIATVLLCAAASLVVPAQYSASADILLTPPRTTGATGNNNPYLALSGIQPLADIIARAMNQEATLAKLRSKGLSGTYTVVRDASTDGPVLIVTTTSKTGAAAISDLNLVVATAEPALNLLQASQNVAEASRVQAETVTSTEKASTTRKTQIRALVVAGAFGLIATAIAMSVLDGLLTRRKRRRLATEPIASGDVDLVERSARRAPSSSLRTSAPERVNGAATVSTAPPGARRRTRRRLPGATDTATDTPTDTPTDTATDTATDAPTDTATDAEGNPPSLAAPRP